MQSTTATVAAFSLDGAHPSRQAPAPDDNFIRHPLDYPLTVQTAPPWRQQRRPTASGPGLIFDHSAYLRPGSWLTLSIPMRDVAERFDGRVILLREINDGYQVGVQLLDDDQTARLRIVEQFCYMSCYCHNVEHAAEHHGSGKQAQSFANDHERHARHWVDRFAGVFPSL